MTVVHILMATLNGAAYIHEQLNSLLAQTHGDWVLHASDDGSDDTTRALLAGFSHTHPGRLAHMAHGPGRGHAANFLSLLATTPSGATAAFCDQDDIWLPQKLANAVAALAVCDAPTLYCTARWVYHTGTPPTVIDGFPHCRPSFANALIQNIASGNTVVLNPAAVQLLQQALGLIRQGDVLHHDWLCYQLITGAGGRVIYDPTPSLYYRQHGQNLIGEGTSPKARLKRAQSVLTKRHRQNTTQQAAALWGCRSILTPANQKLLSTFRTARAKPLAPRILGLAQTGIHRQSPTGTASMWAAAALRRL